MQLSSRLIRVLACLFALAMLALPIAAVAAPANAKLITALYSAAQKEFDAGNFERAAELFLNIYQQDPTQPTALYNAARAAHLAGKIDRAEELYGRYEVAPGAEAAKIDKIKVLRGEIRAKRGELRAEEAAAAERGSQYALAAQLWADALRLNPRKLPWLLRMARAKQLAGQKDAALKDYDSYLAEAPAEDPGRVDAARWRAEVAPASYGEVPVPKEAPVVQAVVVEAPARWPAFAVLGGGAAVLAGGAALLGLASGDEAALNEKIAVKKDGVTTGISSSEAKTEAARIEGRYTLGWAVAGAGALATGVGVYLWLALPQAKVAVLPTGNGALLAVRF